MLGSRWRCRIRVRSIRRAEAVAMWVSVAVKVEREAAASRRSRRRVWAVVRGWEMVDLRTALMLFGAEKFMLGECLVVRWWGCGCWESCLVER